MTVSHKQADSLVSSKPVSNRFQTYQLTLPNRKMINRENKQEIENRKEQESFCSSRLYTEGIGRSEYHINENNRQRKEREQGNIQLHRDPTRKLPIRTAA